MKKQLDTLFLSVALSIDFKIQPAALRDGKMPISNCCAASVALLPLFRERGTAPPSRGNFRTICQHGDECKDRASGKILQPTSLHLEQHTLDIKINTQSPTLDSLKP